MSLCGCEFVPRLSNWFSMLVCVLLTFFVFLFVVSMYYVYISFKVPLFCFSLCVLCILISRILELLANPSGTFYLGHIPGTSEVPEVDGQFDGGAARRDVS